MNAMDEKPQIMAIDCCQHILNALNLTLTTQHVPTASNGDRIKLIAIGLSKQPVHRIFIGHLRRIYPHLPMLILRRTHEGISDDLERIRGEFILSDNPTVDDLEIVRCLRNLFPLGNCVHLHKGSHYEAVQEVARVIAEKFPDPELDLNHVARALPISSSHLSRILNKQVGVSFPQLLRHMRIEAAKAMLASRRYSIKEVAVRVGFTDSHYFSRSFKEQTGVSATSYQAKNSFLGREQYDLKSDLGCGKSLPLINSRLP